MVYYYNSFLKTLYKQLTQQSHPGDLPCSVASSPEDSDHCRILVTIANFYMHEEDREYYAAHKLTGQCTNIETDSTS